MATYLLLNDAAASMLCEVPRSSVLFREIMEKNGDLLSCFNFKMLQLLFSFFFLSWARSKDFFFLRVCCCHEDVGFLCFAIILSMPQKEADYFLGLDEER